MFPGQTFGSHVDVGFLFALTIDNAIHLIDLVRI